MNMNEGIFKSYVAKDLTGLETVWPYIKRDHLSKVHPVRYHGHLSPPVCCCRYSLFKIIRRGRFFHTLHSMTEPINEVWGRIYLIILCMAIFIYISIYNLCLLGE